MNMKRGLMILSLGAAVALGGFGSGQAFFNSPLAANSHYRPINFGMGYEMYVDLSSLETVKDDGQGWIFKVNLFMCHIEISCHNNRLLSIKFL